MSRTKVVALVLCSGLLAACASRTAPATQGTIKAFDPAASDPKAVAIVDQMIAALGGEANWAAAKEVKWRQGIVVDGKLQAVMGHAWDRWDGRHQYANWLPDGGQSVTMHELFTDTAFAYIQPVKGQRMPKTMKEDKLKSAQEAKRRFDIDAYQFALPFKLKDPGVKLAFSEERQAEGAPADSPMKYDVVKVTFEPGVGPRPGDVWYVIIDKETHVPEMYEHVLEGKADNERGGYLLRDWVEAGGLKFATKRITLGYSKLDNLVQLEIPPTWSDLGFQPMQVPNPGEVILIREINVSVTAEDDLYVPDVDTMTTM